MYAEDGGSYTSLYTAEASSFSPLMTSSMSTHVMNYMQMDAFLIPDEYNLLRPGIAESYTVSDDGLVYTFKIREGVMWYTSEGEEYAEVVAQDWVDAMMFITDKDNASPHSTITSAVLLNAAEYWDGTITDFSQVGVKAIDKYTVEYTLKAPAPYFLRLTCYVPFLPQNGAFIEEVGDFYGTSAEFTLNFGAYIFTEFEPENKRVFEKNEAYYYADKIHIDEVVYQYNKEATAIGPEMFLRGEIEYVSLTATTVDEWLNDEEKVQYVTPAPLSIGTAMYLFNFDPQYEEEYAPDDFKKAVNNEDFRQSIFWAFDNAKSLQVIAPYDHEERMVYTISLPGAIVYDDGTDYADVASVEDYNEDHYVDVDLANDHAAKAKAALESEGVTFPIQFVIPYSTASSTNAEVAQMNQDILESALGEDYIDVVLVPYAPTNFTENVLIPGKFSWYMISWAPDFVDPLSMSDLFREGSAYSERYGKAYSAEEFIADDGSNIYNTLVETALAETTDIDLRYDLYAEAERMLIEKAMVKPVYRSGGGYVASMVDPFTGWADWASPFIRNMNGKKLLNRPMSLEEYDLYAAEYEAELNEARANYDFNAEW